MVFSHPIRNNDLYNSSRIIDNYHDPTKKKNVTVRYTLDLNDLFAFYEEALLNHLKLN